MADAELDAVTYDMEFDSEDYEFQRYIKRDKWLSRAKNCLSRAFEYGHIRFARSLHEAIEQHLEFLKEDYRDEQAYNKSPEAYYGVSRYDFI
jgi:23S rRNA maturation-related 3'-5' exoribonuclease YhaM